MACVQHQHSVRRGSHCRHAGFAEVRQTSTQITQTGTQLNCNACIYVRPPSGWTAQTASGAARRCEAAARHHSAARRRGTGWGRLLQIRRCCQRRRCPPAAPSPVPPDPVCTRDTSRDQKGSFIMCRHCTVLTLKVLMDHCPNAQHLVAYHKMLHGVFSARLCVLDVQDDVVENGACSPQHASRVAPHWPLVQVQSLGLDAVHHAALLQIQRPGHSAGVGRPATRSMCDNSAGAHHRCAISCDQHFGHVEMLGVIILQAEISYICLLCPLRSPSPSLLPHIFKGTRWQAIYQTFMPRIQSTHIDSPGCSEGNFCCKLARYALSSPACTSCFLLLGSSTSLSSDRGCAIVKQMCSRQQTCSKTTDRNRRRDQRELGTPGEASDLICGRNSREIPQKGFAVRCRTMSKPAVVFRQYTLACGTRISYLCCLATIKSECSLFVCKCAF